MRGLPPLGGVPLGLVGAGLLCGSPSSTVQALPPSECFFLVPAGCGLHRSHHKPPLPPQVACQGSTSSAPLPTAARSAAVLLFQTPLLILQITSYSNLAEPSLATLASLSQDLAIELAALLGSSGSSSSSSNLPLGRGSPAPQIMKPRAPGPPGAQPH